MKDFHKPFENLGFYTEYLFEDGKLAGTKEIAAEKVVNVGHKSLEKHIAKENIKFKNKTIKKGTPYMTVNYPLCGKVIKTQNK